MIKREKDSLTFNCVELLKQGISLLERLDDDFYVRTQEGLHSRSGVGSHFRHCLDFITNFLRGTETGTVDYNKRERDENIERCPSAAVKRMHEIIADLQNLPIDDPDAALLICLEGNSEDFAALCKSTLMRELEFLQSHLTHHYALIAFMLRLQGVEIDDEFGVTPSTLAYWRTKKAYAA